MITDYFARLICLSLAVFFAVHLLAGLSIAQATPLAARVAAHAEGGQILVTPEVSAAVDDSTEFSFTDAGTVELKGLTGDYRIQTLRWQADPAAH